MRDMVASFLSALLGRAPKTGDGRVPAQATDGEQTVDSSTGPPPGPPAGPAVSPAADGPQGGTAPMAGPAGDMPETALPARPDLSAALRRIFARRDPTQAGSIHLMGLESLQEKLGDRWEDIAGRVHQLAEKLLARHLSPHDAWFRHGAEAYVVVFAHLGPDQARLVCAKVVEELQVMLLGGADTDSITVRTVLHEVGSEIVLVSANLHQMLDAVRARVAGQPPDPAILPPVAEGMGRYAPLEKAGPLQVRYRPVWDVGRQVLSLYMARGFRARPGRSPLWGYDCLEDPADPQQILDLDIRVANESLATALELYDNRFRFFLSLPVHFESLAATARRQTLVRILRDIPRHLLPFTTYHFHGVPAGVPAGRLSELVAAVKPFGRTVMLEVPLTGADLGGVETSGIRVVNAALPPGASAERWRPDITRFAQQALRHHLLPAVEGVEGMAMEDLCEESGIRFLSGELIGGWVDVPEHVVRRSRTDFQRQQLLLDPHRKGQAPK